MVSGLCAWCEEAIGDSPSDDFCNETCERAWLSKHNNIDDLPTTRYAIPWWGWQGL